MQSTGMKHLLILQIWNIFMKKSNLTNLLYNFKMEKLEWIFPILKWIQISQISQL